MGCIITFRYADATNTTGTMTVPTARDVAIYTGRLKRDGCIITRISPMAPETPATAA